MTQSRQAALGLALVPFVALGLARFAYGLLLPAMQHDLSWSYGEAGSLTTANAAGYLAGAMVVPALVRRWGLTAVVRWSCWMMSAALLLHAATTHLWLLLLLRAVAGLAGGTAFVAGGVLAAELTRRGAVHALLWYPAGAGAGIAVSVAVLPAIASVPRRWPLGWALLGALAVIVSAVVAGVTQGGPAHDRAQQNGRAARLPFVEVAYGLFGLGYIGYVTFAIAHLRSVGASTGEVAWFWFLLGTASVVSCLLWPRLLQSRLVQRSLPLSLAITTVGAASLVVSDSPVVTVASGLCFGSSFLAVVTAVTSQVRDRLPPTAWPGAVARLTVVFGVGQVIGPLLAGRIGDSEAGLRVGLGVSAVLLGLATTVAMRTPRAPTPARGDHSI